MSLTTYEPSSNGTSLAATAADQSAKGAARIVQWAQSAAAAHDLAVALCETSFCPEQFRGKPGEATAAILAGGEVGLSPLGSLKAFDIIKGSAAPKAITLRAIVLSFGHEIELVEASETRCRMQGRRRGAQNWQEVTWTIERARKLKLASKPNWQDQPIAMLQARATSELCRLVAADAILGIGYAAEELEDMMAEEQTGPRKVQRRATPKAIATPDPADDDHLLGEGSPPTEDAVAPEAPTSGAGDVDLEPTGDWPDVPEPGTVPAG